MTNTQRTSIVCNHINISVITKGPSDGKMILLLHGFPEQAESWMDQMNFLAGLGYFVVAPDQRGYAQSTAPDSTKAYTLDKLGLDMLSLVKHFRSEKVLIVGHDWGAIVGWYLITFFPETFEKALLASAPHWDVFKKYLLSHPKQIFKSWYIFFIQIPLIPEMIFGMNSYSVLTSMMRKHDYPESKIGLLNFKKLKSMMNWYRAMKYLSIKTPAQKIQVPTLIVWGEEDPFCMSEMAEISREYCQNGDVVIMKGVGHWPQHQNKEEFNSILKSHFNS